jgi:hypothetical protein
MAHFDGRGFPCVYNQFRDLTPEARKMIAHDETVGLNRQKALTDHETAST